MRWPKMLVPGGSGDCEYAWMGMSFIVSAGRIRYGKTAMFDGPDADLTAAG